jgi:sulfotransferase
MEKQYYFLAGFPRSGNTVLSSILNQNPQVYCSPLSPISDFLWSYEQVLQTSENAKRNLNNGVIDIGKNIITNYYKDINKKIIIDREKAWATPINLGLIKKYINENPKIIFTVRPIIEILTSFISLLDEESYIDKDMQKFGWWSKEYLTKNDNRCEYLMRQGGQIDKILFSLNEVLKLNNKNNFYIMEYDRLIEHPQKTMDEIYNFLEISGYEHDFNNIVKIEEDIDNDLGLPKNLHDVRKKINKINKNPKQVLSQYIIDKYSNIGWEKI